MNLEVNIASNPTSQANCTGLLKLYCPTDFYTTKQLIGKPVKAFSFSVLGAVAEQCATSPTSR